jgi:Leucine-rich repeat (LRR) protein
MEGYSSDSSDAELSSTTLDLSHQAMVTSGLQQHIEQLLETKKNSADLIETILLYSNNLLDLPVTILQFHSLKVVDLSCNGLSFISSLLTQLSLTSLILKNNNLDSDSFPKSFGLLENSLKELNLSGNRLSTVPEQILELKSLKYLYLGSNRISEIPRDVKNLIRQV